MRELLIFFSFLTVVALSSFAALAQTAIGCGTLDEVAQQLKTQFGEERIGAGLSTHLPNGRQGQVLYQMFQSGAGTWTLVISAPDGSACVLAAGANWEIYPIPKTGTEG